MRRLVLAWAAAALLSLPAPSVAYAAAAPVQLDQPPAFPWKAKSTFFVADAVPGTAYDVEINRSPMVAAAQSPDWTPLTTGSTAVRYPIRLRPGTVACLRARVSGDPANEWGEQRCVVRPVLATKLTVRGPHATYVAPRWRGRFNGVVLYPGGRLALPGVPSGGHLVLRYTSGPFTATAPHWGIAGQPEPDESLTLIGYELGHEVAVGGRALVWAADALPTLPVHDLAVLPSWVPRTPRTADGWSLQGNEVYPDFYSESRNSLLTFTRRPMLSWGHEEDNPSFTLRLQVARGPMAGSRPPWVDRPVSRFASQLRLRVRPGQVLCVRARNERIDGEVTVWHRTCVVHPADDSQVRVVGRRLRAADPLSVDGRSTRLGAGSRFVLGRVGPHPLIGVVSYPRPAWPNLAEETLDGRAAHWRSGSATGVESPLYPRADLWWSTFRRGGKAAIRNPATPWPEPSERISGVYVVPGWAR
ncbi:MAG: hypothetical protein R2731_14035 [Nocardioides sp.]